ncbi:MAG: hypothetical protein JWM50_221 [Microbacteriaceae bacterium]|nr:hypothetical protein [Microbacteriaceae bacterium]
MTARVGVGCARLVFAVVCLVSLISRFIWGLGSSTFTAGNFFAYLTMQSNIAFLVVCVVGGLVAVRSRSDPPWLTNLHAVVLSWTVVAGVVFAILVQQAGERSFHIDVPWSDQVLHFWLPAFALLEWMIAPGRGRAQWRILYLVLGYPVVWGVLTLIRGASVGWYPYFFLDPGQVRDPFEFTLYSSLALATFGVIGSLVISAAKAQPLGERYGRGRVAPGRPRGSRVH